MSLYNKDNNSISNLSVTSFPKQGFLCFLGILGFGFFWILVLQIFTGVFLSFFKLMVSLEVFLNFNSEKMLGWAFLFFFTTLSMYPYIFIFYTMGFFKIYKSLFTFFSNILKFCLKVKDFLLGFNYKGFLSFWFFIWWVSLTVYNDPKGGLFSNFMISFVSWEVNPSYYFLISMIVNFYLVIFVFLWVYTKSPLPSKWGEFGILFFLVIISISSLIPTFKLIQGASPWKDFLMFVFGFLVIFMWFLVFVVFNIKSNMLPFWSVISFLILLVGLELVFFNYSISHVSYDMTGDNMNHLLFLWESYSKASGGMEFGVDSFFESLFMDSNGSLPPYWIGDNDPSKKIFLDMMWALSMEPKVCEDFAFFVENFLSGSKLNVSVHKLF